MSPYDKSFGEENSGSMVSIEVIIEAINTKDNQINSIYCPSSYKPLSNSSLSIVCTKHCH